MNGNQAGNDVGTLAANNSGAGTITYQDANAVSVGTVAAAGAFGLTTGVSSRGLATDDILIQNGAGVMAVAQEGSTEPGGARVAGKGREPDIFGR